jgi:hypothetical protein
MFDNAHSLPRSTIAVAYLGAANDSRAYRPHPSAQENLGDFQKAKYGRCKTQAAALLSPSSATVGGELGTTSIALHSSGYGSPFPRAGCSGASPA